MNVEFKELLQSKAKELNLKVFDLCYVTNPASWVIESTVSLEYKWYRICAQYDVNVAPIVTCTLSTNKTATEEFLKYAQDLEIMFI